MEITVPQGTQTVPVRDGVARFELTTTSIEIRLIGGSGATREVALLGMDLPAPHAEFTVPCGQGPVVTVDGFSVPDLGVGHARRLPRAPAAAVPDLRGPGRAASTCPAGQHEVRTERSDSFVVQDLWLLSRQADRTPRRPGRST